MSDYVAMGALALYFPGTEVVDLPAVWDWKRIPGTTTSDAPLMGCGLLTNFSPPSPAFVGGVSTGSVGAVGMIVNASMGAFVRAKKSCFMLDKGVACLGSGISTTAAGGRVFTTVATQLLVTNTTIKTSAGSFAQGNMTLECNPGNGVCRSWVNYNKVGYVILTPNASVSVIAKSETRQGSWQSVGISTGSVTAQVFSVVINHSISSPVAPSTYAYLILPDATPTATKTLAQAPNPWFQVLRLDDSCHAVVASAQRAKLVSAIFWEAATVLVVNNSAQGWRWINRIEVSLPCMLVAEINSSGIILTVSNPDRLSAPIDIVLDGKWYGNSASSTTATIATYMDSAVQKVRTRVSLILNDIDNSNNDSEGGNKRLLGQSKKVMLFAKQP